MKKITSIALALLATSLFLFWYIVKKESNVDENTLIVGTNAEYPPFTFIEKGEIVGFDISIVNEVIKRLGKKMILKDMAYDMLIPEIQLGKIHLIAAGMTASEKRAKQVFFTKPYYKDDPLVAITLKKNPISSVDDLTGKEVIVNEGYTADVYMSSLKGPIIKRLPAPAESLLDLQTEKSFAYVCAYAAIKPSLNKLGKDQFNILILPGPKESYSLAVAKQYPQLFEQIQKVLDAMEKDGAIDAIKKEWGLE